MTTLDALIERHGMPSFVKIDVEGAEPDVLSGLSHPVATLSFEYLPRALELVADCTHRLAELGDYRFAWSPGESFTLSGEWVTARELLASLRTRIAEQSSGDVYAALQGGAA
jgi:hypothetical protein